MAYDEDLADRVRAVLPPVEAVTERQMFGGLAFMLGGHMFCGVVRDTLMVRLGPEGADRALNLPHVWPMDFTGRPVKGMVFVEPGGLHGAALGEWVAAAAAFARALRPSQLPGPPASARDAARGVTAVRQIRAGLQPSRLSIKLLRNKMVVVVFGARQ